jgi:flagellar motility protein MotE (MotC chaperone)
LRVSSLLVLAFLFFASFVARAAAIAADATKKGGEERTAAAPSEAPAASGRCVDAGLGASILQAAERLEAKELDLAAREETLNAMQERIEQRLAELDAVRKEFSEAAGKLADAKSAELGKVAAVYANMKPAQAASIVDGMDARFAAGLLVQMNGESAAAIVAAMDPKKAYAVTVLMANGASRDGER